MDAAVDRVADPPSVPSLLQAVPEIFEAEAVNETSGDGTAAFAEGIRRLLVKSKKTPTATAVVFFALLITD